MTVNRGPGRPPIGRVVEVRFTDEQLDAIDQHAENTGTKRPEAIRQLVQAGLDTTAKKGKKR